MNTSPLSTAPRWRARILCLILLISVVVYALVLIALYRGLPAAERAFPPPAVPPELHVYVDDIAMNPIRQELLVRIDFGTSSAGGGTRYPGMPAMDLIVEIGDGSFVQTLPLPRAHAASAVEFGVGMKGSINTYPLDRYVGRLLIKVKNAETQELVPVQLTVWSAMSSWESNMYNTHPAGGTASGIDLTIEITRPPAFIVVGLAMYASMIVIGLSGLTIGILVFMGVRRIETTLTGALGAIVFSVPALRNLLPGTPPLGVYADVGLLVWVVLAAILSLALFVATWAQRGPAP